MFLFLHNVYVVALPKVCFQFKGQNVENNELKGAKIKLTVGGNIHILYDRKFKTSV